jgi:hypothetical protein
LVLTAALAVSVGSGQPLIPESKDDKNKRFRPYYTAFPDLKPPTFEKKEIKKPDGTVVIELEEKGAVPLPALPELAADAPALRKVQFEQVQEGLAYIERVKEVIKIGAWDARFFREFIGTVVETYRVAAELEEKPAKRVAWYEARVRKLKEFELFVEHRTLSGTDPPQAHNLARFERLRAEADLLKLKAEVEKPGK